VTVGTGVADVADGGVVEGVIGAVVVAAADVVASADP
jgi:hypothetical protein